MLLVTANNVHYYPLSNKSATVFPNPTIANISVVNHTSGEIVNCKLYSISGELLQIFEKENFDNINLNQPIGSYILTITILVNNIEYYYVEKVIIE